MRDVDKASDLKTARFDSFTADANSRAHLMFLFANTNPKLDLELTNL